MMRSIHYLLCCAFFVFVIGLPSCVTLKRKETKIYFKAKAVLRESIMEKAAWALKQMPLTITEESSPRSAGGRHDFYSEGDYWWPDPTDPKGAYIQRDGLTNPDNFVAHRLAMIRFSKVIGALASAYKLSGDKKYVEHAILHLKSWFLNKETMMNANLQYAQAIKGRFTGRGIGIIDTIQLMEVAQGILVMQEVMEKEVLAGAKKWFGAYLNWLMNHPYGQAEMAASNNHGTCFVMQVASFAKLTGNEVLLSFCRERYKTVLLTGQMAPDGSFPKELARTKPYSYSIFNLDAMVAICQILSVEKDNLWTYRTSDGRSIQRGIEYLSPYIADKGKWPLKPDVMYWNDWPVAQPFLLFGAQAYQNTEWFRIWSDKDHDPKVEEIIRNLPIRNPLIWL